MSEELTEEQKEEAIASAFIQSIHAQGPGYLIEQSGKLIGHPDHDEQEQATAFCMLAFQSWGMDGLQIYAGQALLVDVDFVEETVIEHADFRQLLNAALTIRGINVDYLLTAFYERHVDTPDEELGCPLDQIVTFYIDAVNACDPAALAKWAVELENPEIAVTLLLNRYYDEEDRRPLLKLIDQKGSWTQKARITLNQPNVVTKNIRNSVSKHLMFELEEVKAFAHGLYTQCNGDTVGLATAIKTLGNDTFTAEMEELAKKTMETMITEAGGLENLIDNMVTDEMVTKFAAQQEGGDPIASAVHKASLNS